MKNPHSFADWPALLQSAQLQVAVSWRLKINTQNWRLNLRSPFWRIYVNHRHGAHIIFQNQRIELRPDQVHLIPEWVPFQTGADQTGTQDFIHFYLAGFPPHWLHRLFDRPISLDKTEPLDSLIQHWQGGLEQQNEAGLSEFFWSHALSHAVLAQCIPQVWKEKGAQSADWLRESSAVWPAIERIESRLSEPPKNSELAALCQLNATIFVRQFRQVVGVTPAQYGLERRIAAAAHRLVHSEQNIETIAAATGFTDRFHFSKTFKQRMQLSPVAYRKMHWQKS